MKSIDTDHLLVKSLPTPFSVCFSEGEVGLLRTNIFEALSFKLTSFLLATPSGDVSSFFDELLSPRLFARFVDSMASDFKRVVQGFDKIYFQTEFREQCENIAAEWVVLNQVHFTQKKLRRVI